MRLLLSWRADVHPRRQQNITPLHWAAARGFCEVAKLLLDMGADMRAVDARGDTPLAAAARCGQAEVVALLLEREEGGADALAATSGVRAPAPPPKMCVFPLEMGSDSEREGGSRARPFGGVRRGRACRCCT